MNETKMYIKMLTSSEFRFLTDLGTWCRTATRWLRTPDEQRKIRWPQEQHTQILSNMLFFTNILFNDYQAYLLSDSFLTQLWGEN
jgi:hypothetical protein